MNRVYEYGLLDPITNAHLVEDQLRSAHRYRNVLVEIERERRSRVREILAGHADTVGLADEVERLTTALEAAQVQIKQTRAASRRRSETTDDRALVRDLSTQLKTARAQLKEAKTFVAKDPMIQRALATADQRAHDRQIEERARCGVYWSTYLLIEEDVDRARKGKMDPKFQRFTGEGRVSAQLQGGLDWSEIGNDTQLQIHDAPDPRAGRRAGHRKILRLRIGSGGTSRQPIWAEWPLTLHRALPEGARIKRATVTRWRRDCRRWEWRLQLLLDVSACASSKKRPSEGACALNLGWAKTDRGLRAGYVVGQDGQRTEIVLPASILERLDKANAIRAQRDQNLDALKAQLSAWLADHPLPTPPEDAVAGSLKARADHLHAWRAPERFFSLAQAWKQQRFDGDAVGYELLEAWRYRDEHLQRYEAGMRRGALGHRREIYRMIGAELATRYRMLVVDDTDLRTFQRSPEAGSTRVEFDAVKRAQHVAAPSDLRMQLMNAFGETSCAELSAVDVTRKCHACSAINDWDRAASGREHACVACGAVWDQDVNACLNLLGEWKSAEPGWEAARAAKAANRKESRSEKLQKGRKKKPEAEALAM
jgi:hypothetical protein